MDPMDELLSTIDAALARKGLSDAAASKLAVGNYALIKNLRSSRATSPEDRRTNFHALQKLADVLGLECYFGPPRETGPVEQVMINGSDYAQIPLHDVALAAGSGAENGTEHVVEHMAFKRDWLKREGINVSAARLARVHGDSMTPTIASGDVVLIDTSKRTPPLRSPLSVEVRHRAPIFALRNNDGAVVKRLLRPADDQLMLVSDNPDYLPQIMKLTEGAESAIIGKVVWWGHTNRD